MKRKQIIRDNFRDAVFKRDVHRCKRCNTSGVKLDAHHIMARNEMPNGGYVLENGITLCDPLCHMLAEKFHASRGREWEPNMHPDDLYLMIGSSYDEAVRTSEKLK